MACLVAGQGDKTAVSSFGNTTGDGKQGSYSQKTYSTSYSTSSSSSKAANFSSKTGDTKVVSPSRNSQKKWTEGVRIQSPNPQVEYTVSPPPLTPLPSFRYTLSQPIPSPPSPYVLPSHIIRLNANTVKAIILKFCQRSTADYEDKVFVFVLAVLIYGKGAPAAAAGGGAPLFQLSSQLTRSASTVKDMLLNWCQCRTRDYKGVKIENFSTSWNDGMAFCALVHHFYPDAFDFDALNPKNRRHNFELAFRTAE
ncbi:Smoothelin [Chionoecetes opilio]|uniref:Smoothelin n=1 Tax=Chionoecetes opilio TaxID=41210 RepID=A0A8J5CZS5_CHIOP|nr:Smoothelin [Chionoecetes opilio]